MVLTLRTPELPTASPEAFLADDFFADDFLADDFFAPDFLALAFFFAPDFLADDFFAPDFLAVVVAAAGATGAADDATPVPPMTDAAIASTRCSISSKRAEKDLSCLATSA